MIGGDLSPFFQSAHFASTVVWGAVTGTGIFDAPGDLLHDGDIVSTDYTLMVKTSEFGAVQYGDAITVGGVSYTVRFFRSLDDGQLGVIVMTKV
jgi:hypothetical protein